MCSEQSNKKNFLSLRYVTWEETNLRADNQRKSLLLVATRVVRALLYPRFSAETVFVPLLKFNRSMDDDQPSSLSNMTRIWIQVFEPEFTRKRAIDLKLNWRIVRRVLLRRCAPRLQQRGDFVSAATEDLGEILGAVPSTQKRPFDWWHERFAALTHALYLLQAILKTCWGQERDEQCTTFACLPFKSEDEKIDTTNCRAESCSKSACAYITHLVVGTTLDYFLRTAIAFRIVTADAAAVASLSTAFRSMFFDPHEPVLQTLSDVQHVISLGTTVGAQLLLGQILPIVLRPHASGYSGTLHGAWQYAAAKLSLVSIVSLAALPHGLDGVAFNGRAEASYDLALFREEKRVNAGVLVWSAAQLGPLERPLLGFLMQKALHQEWIEDLAKRATSNHSRRSRTKQRRQTKAELLRRVFSQLEFVDFLDYLCIFWIHRCFNADETPSLNANSVVFDLELDVVVSSLASRLLTHLDSFLSRCVTLRNFATRQAFELILLHHPRIHLDRADQGILADAFEAFLERTPFELGSTFDRRLLEFQHEGLSTSSFPWTRDVTRFLSTVVRRGSKQ